MSYEKLARKHKSNGLFLLQILDRMHLETGNFRHHPSRNSIHIVNAKFRRFTLLTAKRHHFQLKRLKKRRLDIDPSIRPELF